LPEQRKRAYFKKFQISVLLQRRGPLTSSEVSKIVNLCKGQALRYLRRLAQEGRAEIVNGGKRRKWTAT